MLGGLGNLTGLMKTAREFQGNLAKMQAELAERRFDADAGGGMVRVTVDGKGRLVDVKIEPSAAKDIELLEDLIKGAVCAAMVKSQDAMKEEMSKLTGGMNLPGLGDLLGQGGPTG